MAINTETFNYLTEKSRKNFEAKILADSVDPTGVRLTTWELTYPRCIHSEFMTHRDFSRNSASSRAIPMKKMIADIQSNPFIPLDWGKNQKGMSASSELPAAEKCFAMARWLNARNDAVEHAVKLEELGLHKQIGNRILEPWMWIKVIASTTKTANFFALRCHKDAEPHMQLLASLMYDSLQSSTPVPKTHGEWHLPMIGIEGDELLSEEEKPMVSAGRCARVSYLTHAGVRDTQEDIALYNKLAKVEPMHASPLEHQARVAECAEELEWLESSKIHGPTSYVHRSGNFHGLWVQFRKIHASECVADRKHLSGTSSVETSD